MCYPEFVVPFPILTDFQQDGIPLWEKKFCTFVGLVPWQKLVDTKNFTSCHSNVLTWNDSAAEEAFQNAKKQYWAKTNNLPCDSSLPHSDIYIDKIDWNPCIDPELIKDVDSVYFAPSDEEERDAVSYKRTKISSNVENSQECDESTELDQALENKVEGWNQCESSKHKSSPGNSEKNANNPWEFSVSRENRGLTRNALEGGGAKVWGWNQVSDHSDRLNNWGCGLNPWQNGNNGWDKACDDNGGWDRACDDNSGWDKACDDNRGWGKARDDNKGWGRTWDNSWNPKQSNYSSNFGRPWGGKSDQRNRAPTGRGWRNCEENSPGWKQHRNGNHFSGDVQCRRQSEDWTSGNQNFQKNQSYHQSSVGSRFQRDSHQTDHHWRRENSKKFSFA